MYRLDLPVRNMLTMMWVCIVKTVVGEMEGARNGFTTRHAQTKTLALKCVTGVSADTVKRTAPAIVVIRWVTIVVEYTDISVEDLHALLLLVIMISEVVSAPNAKGLERVAMIVTALLTMVA